MFKGFTWAKFLADLTVVAGLVSGPLSGMVGNKVAAVAVTAGVVVRAIASLFTTTAAGAATDATGKPISG